MKPVEFDPETQGVLDRFAFDAGVFETLRDRLRGSGVDQQGNILTGAITPPAAGDVIQLPALGTPARAELNAQGGQAVAAGQVGVVILAGGMATRFGGVVKAAAEALDGRSFLDLKLADIQAVARRHGGRLPVFLMTSFATHDAVAALGAARATAEVPIETFPQFVSVRLQPDGELFVGNDGRPSLYATGHGDLTFALQRSGVLDRFRAAGGKHLVVSNVDNLAATVDAGVVGAHMAAGRPVTVEVAPKAPGDKGGAPARVDGVVQIVESFRFPPAFDQDSIPVFNTNTFVLDAVAVDRSFDLTWFAVKKTIDGREAVQFERLVGQVTAFLPSQFLRVDRDGPDGRFQPAKDPEELSARRDEIRRILSGRGVFGS